MDKLLTFVIEILLLCGVTAIIFCIKSRRHTRRLRKYKNEMAIKELDLIDSLQEMKKKAWILEADLRSRELKAQVEADEDANYLEESITPEQLEDHDGSY